MDARFSNHYEKMLSLFISSRIRRFVVLGDSLCDRGTLMKRHLFGVIPMSFIVSLSTKSHHGRFTNGFTWDDDFGAMFAAHFIARDLEQREFNVNDATDVADGIINGDPNIDPAIHAGYSLDHDTYIAYNQNRDFIRMYCEGGLTSRDYHGSFISNFMLFASRQILASLAKKREQLLADDIKHKVTDAQKAETMVIEWSGGNDLVTVNKKPTIEEALNAVQARIDNVTKLIAAGYRCFVLFNLPDLSLTPRYHGASAEVKQEVSQICARFNESLFTKAKEIKALHPDVNIDVFDVNTVFNEVYKDPQRYGFKNTTEPFVDSPYYHPEKDGAMSAHDYMFWDAIHPTARMHALLADAFFTRYRTRIDFVAPKFEKTVTPKCMFEKFMHAYDARFKDDQNGYLGNWRVSRLREDFKQQALEDKNDYMRILSETVQHALQGGGQRTLEILMQFDWVNQGSEINTAIPTLLRIKEMIENQPEDRHRHGMN